MRHRDTIPMNVWISLSITKHLNHWLESRKPNVWQSSCIQDHRTLTTLPHFAVSKLQIAYQQCKMIHYTLRLWGISKNFDSDHIIFRIRKYTNEVFNWKQWHLLFVTDILGCNFFVFWFVCLKVVRVECFLRWLHLHYYTIDNIRVKRMKEKA